MLPAVIDWKHCKGAQSEKFIHGLLQSSREMDNDNNIYQSLTTTYSAVAVLITLNAGSHLFGTKSVVLPQAPDRQRRPGIGAILEAATG